MLLGLLLFLNSFEAVASISDQGSACAIPIGTVFTFNQMNSERRPVTPIAVTTSRNSLVYPYRTTGIFRIGCSVTVLNPEADARYVFSGNHVVNSVTCATIESGLEIKIQISGQARVIHPASNRTGGNTQNVTALINCADNRAPDTVFKVFEVRRGFDYAISLRAPARSTDIDRAAVARRKASSEDTSHSASEVDER